MEVMYQFYKKARREGEHIIVNGTDLTTGESVATRRNYLPLPPLLAQLFNQGLEGFQTLDVDTLMRAGATFTTLSALLTSQYDVLALIGLTAALEARSSYDPDFRLSVPGFLRNSTWFL